ncbi:MAG: regulatory signaling modulator protein AmpE [Gammaproteobacteria bacterium]
MKLIIILIALGLERYTPVGGMLCRFSWFSAYLDLLKSFVKSEKFWQGWLGIVLVLLPFVVALGLLALIFSSILGNIGSMVFSFAVLIYCFGPVDLFQKIQACIKDGSTVKEEQAQGLETWGSLTDKEGTHRKLLSNIFLLTHEGIVSVLFWFVLLGPLGAVLYRVTALLEHTASAPKSAYKSMAQQARTLQNILEWVPARLLSLSFALVGHFNAGIKAWIGQAWQGLQSSRELVVACGMISVGIKGEEKKTVSPAILREAMNLIERSLIVLLVLVAVFTLGAWIS